MSWQRKEVELGTLLTPDEYEREGGPRIYRVVALIDSPVAVIVPASEEDSSDIREYHVISSLTFAGFRRVELVSADGVRQHVARPLIDVRDHEPTAPEG